MAASRVGKALPWIVIVVLIVGFGIYEYRLHHGSSDDGSLAVATPSATGVDGVVSGDLPVTDACYETHAGTGGVDDVTPSPRPCSTPHNTVAVAQVQYPQPAGTAYDEQAVADQGRTLCEPKSKAFVGTSTAKFSFVSIYPSGESWDDGDRTVACLVRREGADVAGSLTQ